MSLARESSLYARQISYKNIQRTNTPSLMLIDWQNRMKILFMYEWINNRDWMRFLM